MVFVEHIDHTAMTIMRVWSTEAVINPIAANAIRIEYLSLVSIIIKFNFPYFSQLLNNILVLFLFNQQTFAD